MIGAGSGLFVLVVYGFIVALIIVVLLRLARFLKFSTEEQQKIRIELGKVADEVQRIREKVESYPNGNS